MNHGMSEGDELCAHELFERQAARTPHAIAVVGGGQCWTYREVDERANRIARYLRRLGAAGQSLVGIGMKRSPMMVAALFGVWKAGAAYVPLDPDYPPERLAFMRRDAGLRVLLTDQASCEAFGADGDESRRSICLDSDWDSVASEATTPLDPIAGPRDIAYVIYTSGSTGTPKGAMIEHAGLVNYLRWAAAEYAPAVGASVPVHSSLSFDLTVTSLFVPLLVGAEVELLGSGGAEELVAALRSRKRALVKITPAHLEFLNQQLSPEEMAEAADLFVIGGENLTAERLAPWRRASPHTRLINEYGPTETVVGCCIHEVQPGAPDSGSVPIGRAIANTELHVLDANLRPLPAGVAGELYIGGAGVARGYLNRPELTRERFLPDPFSRRPGARLYKTGDLVRYRADGLLEYLGRLDDQVKIRGYRIEPGEVERVLAGHPDVRSCVVLALDQGAGEKVLVGFVMFGTGRAPSHGDLSAYLGERLPEWMVPSRFIPVDMIPLTANGKVDRRVLESLASTSPPLGAGRVSVGAPPAVLSPTEQTVLAVFRETFNRPDIGSFDNFFDLGGHSLMAVRLMARLRQAAGVNLPLRNLYERPTPAGIAEIIDALRWSGSGGETSPRPQAETRTEITF